MQAAVHEVVCKGLKADPDWGSRFMELFSHIHPISPADQGGGNQQ